MELGLSSFLFEDCKLESKLPLLKDSRNKIY